MAGLTWDAPPEQVFGQMGRVYRDAVTRGVRAICDRYAPEIENWMMDNARWEDRTGDARQSLRAAVEELTNGYIELLLAHGMFYGWYLEGINPNTMTPMANAGQWDIINPALDHFGPRIWDEIVRMLR
jgi:hypothetical protein